MSRDREFDPRDILIAIAHPPPPMFEMGNLAITTNAMNTLDRASWIDGLRRHLRGDWGDLDEEDRHTNDEALQSGDRLLSAYKDAAGHTFWIITEWDRSVTTVLLPDDY